MSHSVTAAELHLVNTQIKCHMRQNEHKTSLFVTTPTLHSSPQIEFGYIKVAPYLDPQWMDSTESVQQRNNIKDPNQTRFPLLHDQR